MSAVAVSMPKLGMTMEEGSVVEWLVAPGDSISKGQVILVIETEKTDADVEATGSGVMRHLYVEAGETVPCGTLLAVFTEDAEEDFDAEAFAAAHVPEIQAEEDEAPEAAVAPASAPAAEVSSSGARRAVAPAARAAARKLGIDPQLVPGTGPGGRVTRQDVEAFAAGREKLFPVADGVALEVLREGEGSPVLLLPGFGTDVSAFSLQIPALLERHRVVGVNPRGVGLSDAPEEDAYEVAQAAWDAAAVLDDLGEPAHVVGASLGAAVALELALARPEALRSLTLITPFVEQSPRLRAVAEAWCQVAEEASPEGVARFLAPWLFSEALLADDAARERTLRGLAASVKRIPAATLRRSAAGMQRWSGSRSGELDSLAVACQVLVAGDDLLTPDGEALAASIPGAKVRVVPGAGHALAIDAAEAVNAALAEVLA